MELSKEAKPAMSTEILSIEQCEKGSFYVINVTRTFLTGGRKPSVRKKETEALKPCECITPRVFARRLLRGNIFYIFRFVRDV